MATTSPYSGNDYQAVSTFRPYQLPVNDIFKALTAQNEFWEAGARRVKSVYDNALNLDLTNAQNQEIRDQYMKDAEKEITKLSAMDLSDPSVQRKGMTIFQPLFKDEGIISDDQATRHIKKVHSDAMSFRTKDNGKFYNATNHRYALDGAEEFKNSADRMAGKQYLEQKKEYEPYYDPTQELTSILKNCGKDNIETESPRYDDGKMTGYSTYNKDASLTAKKVNGCLSVMLSPKAKRQLQIDGYVAYKNNPQALADKYTRFAANSLSYLQAEYDKDVVGKLAGLEEKRKKGQTLSAQEQVEYETYSNIGASYNQQITNYKQQLANIARGDLGFLQENMEEYAGQLHSADVISGWAEGASYNNISQKLVADPVQLTHIKYEQAMNLQNDRQNFEFIENEKDRLHAINAATLKGTGARMKKNANGEWVVDLEHMESYNTKDLTEADAQLYGKSSFDQEFADVTNQLAEYNSMIIHELNLDAQNTEVTMADGTKVKVSDYIKNHAPEDIVDISKGSFLNSYLTNAGASTAVKNAFAEKQRLTNHQLLLEKRRTQIEGDLSADFPAAVTARQEILNEHSNNTFSIKLSNGKTITKTGAEWLNEFDKNRMHITKAGAIGERSMHYDGPEGKGEVVASGKPALKKFLAGVVGYVDKRGRYNEERQKRYAEAGFEIKGFKQILEPHEGLQNVLDSGLSPEQKKDVSVQQRAFNGTGEIIVQVNGMKPEQAMAYLRKTQLGREEPRMLGNGTFVIKTDQFFKVPGTLGDADHKIVKLLESNSNSRQMRNPAVPTGTVIDNYPQSIMTQSGLRTFDLVVKKGMGGVPYYDIFLVDPNGTRTRMNRSGSITDPNLVVQSLRTYEQKSF